MLYFLKITLVFSFLFFGVSKVAEAQKIDIDDYENKAQGFAILSAQYSKDAYFLARKNFFLNSVEDIQLNCDTAIVYAEIAMEFADSAFFHAHDTSEQAKTIMLLSKDFQQKSIKSFEAILATNDSELIHELSEQSVYETGNAIDDAYKASLYFSWGEEKDEKDGDDGAGQDSTNTEDNPMYTDNDADLGLDNKDFEVPKGVVYRVQIGLFKRKLPDNHFDGVFPIETQISVFEGPATTERTKGNHYRHVAGSFAHYKDAKIAQKMIRDKGYEDAFVIGYLNGKKVSIESALADEGYKVQPEDLRILDENRNVTRLESDESSYETVKEIYNVRVIEIDKQINRLKSEGLNDKDVKRSTNRNNLIALLEEEKKDILSKIKNGEEKLLSVRSDLEKERTLSFQNDEVPTIIDSSLPSGLIYKVQVGFYKNQLPPEHFGETFPITTTKTDDQIYYKYLTGNFVNYEEAQAAKSSVLKRGYLDSFIIAYIDGEKVSIKEALDKEKQMK